uniref:RanBP2-type domain-containing protein n=1 Tax=Rhizochromulina marina TaxID=1034831 RepID=A0A7S2RDG9_9STRA
MSALMEHLRELTKMREDGALTEEEFTTFKRKLMEESKSDPGSGDEAVGAKRRRHRAAESDDEGDREVDKEETAKKEEGGDSRSTEAWSEPAPVPAAAASQPAPASSTSQPPAGNWTCSVCLNVNWPTRTHCNRKTCGLPRSQVDSAITGGAGLTNGAGGSTWGADPGSTGASWPAQPRPGGAPGAGSRGGKEHPPGSWVCTSCSNINWPMRSSCNRCHASKDPSAILLSPPGPSAVTATPAGSWTCPSCGNVNWPMRTSCNRKNCLMPRPASAVPTAPEVGLPQGHYGSGFAGGYPPVAAPPPEIGAQGVRQDGMGERGYGYSYVADAGVPRSSYSSGASTGFSAAASW